MLLSPLFSFRNIPDFAIGDGVGFQLLTLAIPKRVFQTMPQVLNHFVRYPFSQAGAGSVGIPPFRSRTASTGENAVANPQIPLQKLPFSKNFQNSSKFFQNFNQFLTLIVDNVVRCCQHDEVIHLQSKRRTT